MKVKRKSVVNKTEYRKLNASVTQWQSNRLLTGRLWVRVPLGALARPQPSGYGNWLLTSIPWVRIPEGALKTHTAILFFTIDF